MRLQAIWARSAFAPSLCLLRAQLQAKAAEGFSGGSQRFSGERGWNQDRDVVEVGQQMYSVGIETKLPSSSS